MPRVGNPMSGYAGCRIHDTRKRCAGKLLCRIAHIPRHHPYLMRSEHITTLRRNKSSRNNLSKHWLRQQPASEWLIHPERDRSCTAFPAPQNGSCTMSKRLGSLRRITAARASRRRPAAALQHHRSTHRRCHRGCEVRWRVVCVQQPHTHYSVLRNTTTKLGIKLPSTHRSQKFRDPYSPGGAMPKGHRAKHTNITGTRYQKITTRGMGEKRLKNGRTVTHLHATLQGDRLMCVFKEIRVVP